MRTRKAFTVIELLVLVAIIAILVAIAIPRINRPIQRDPDITGDITELKLPQDFVGTQPPAVCFDRGHLFITYTNDYGEYLTQDYGYYRFAPPRRIHWVKPDKMRER
jgi:hypothetical protein